MTEEKKKQILKGLDEYYANRKDVLSEDINQEIVMIDGLPHIRVHMSTEEFCKKNNLIDINDIQWQM